jgi:hypothetical protein
MFEVFHLSSNLCCKCCIWMFSKVDRVLHLPPCLLIPCLNVSSSSQCRLSIRYDATTGAHRGSFGTRGTGERRPLPLFSMLMTFGWHASPHGARDTECRRGRAIASTTVELMLSYMPVPMYRTCWRAVDHNGLGFGTKYKMRVGVCVKLRMGVSIVSRNVMAVLLWPCLVFKKILQNFSDSSSHRIFGHMYEALNIDKK